MFKHFLGGSEGTYAINSRSADGEVGVSGVTLQVIVGATSLWATTVIFLHHRKNAHANQRRLKCALTYCGSDMSQFLSVVIRAHDLVRAGQQRFVAVSVMCGRGGASISASKLKSTEGKYLDGCRGA